MTPTRIWLLLHAGPEGSHVWCDTPDPDGDGAHEAVEYVRADVSAWQPIETAPKDRGSILVWCPERKNIYTVVLWRGKYVPHAWAHFGGIGGELMEEPTRWMPLPEPPKP